MSRKHFSWLLLVTLLVAAVVLLLPGKTGRESSMENDVFLPALAEQVNDIDWLRLTAAGDAPVATFRREGSNWVVEEASSYRADWNQLKGFLAGLSRARVIEVKTDNPDYYSRLGVEDVSSAEAAGVMVEFAADSGIPAVIIGNNAKAREGQYARLRDSAASVLLDVRVNLPRQQNGWLDKKIIDISDAEAVEFSIGYPGEDAIRALKVSADDENFKLQNIPDGRQIKSEWSVNAPANSLADLDLEAVAPDVGFNWDNSVLFRIVTADGLTVDVDLIVVEKAESETGASSTESGEPEEAEYWLRLRAGIYTTAIEGVTGTSGNDAATAARAEEINRRVDGWAYRIPGYRHDPMTREMEDMLKAEGQ
ncbi:DUF4340 domain-containing protein [Pseudomonadota bacterium]